MALHFKRSSEIRGCTARELLAYHAAPGAFERLTPPFAPAEVLTRTEPFSLKDGEVDLWVPLLPLLPLGFTLRARHQAGGYSDGHGCAGSLSRNKLNGGGDSKGEALADCCFTDQVLPSLTFREWTHTHSFTDVAAASGSGSGSDGGSSGSSGGGEAGQQQPPACVLEDSIRFVLRLATCSPCDIHDVTLTPPLHRHASATLRPRPRRRTRSYRLPLGFLGRALGGRMSQYELSRMFRYRHAVTKSDIQTRARLLRANLSNSGCCKLTSVAVTGSNGLIGAALAAKLSVCGVRVLRITRKGGKGGSGGVGTAVEWDPSDSAGCGGLEALSGVDAGE
jgi:ligand-binding SRPBCC domain-containing protein